MRLEGKVCDQTCLGAPRAARPRLAPMVRATRTVLHPYRCISLLPLGQCSAKREVILFYLRQQGLFASPKGYQLPDAPPPEELPPPKEEDELPPELNELLLLLLSVTRGMLTVSVALW